MSTIKYPLFGIIYNRKGLKEENYLYTAEELERFDEDLYKDCIGDATDWHESQKIECAWKTWMGIAIYNDEILRQFLSGEFNDTAKEDEDDGWYWENVESNDLYGCESNTMREVLSQLKQEGLI